VVRLQPLRPPLSQTGGWQSLVPFSAKCGQTVVCTDSLRTYHHPTQQYYRRPLWAPLPQKGVVMPRIGRVVGFPHLVLTQFGRLLDFAPISIFPYPILR